LEEKATEPRLVFVRQRSPSVKVLIKEVLVGE